MTPLGNGQRRAVGCEGTAVTTVALSPGQGITVAIACFNQARYLDDAIQSVLAQTAPAAEIILVDDGSTDETAVVAQRYPQVAYHRQDNAGLSTARNTGLWLATGGRMLFLDADDMLAPSALELAWERFAAGEELAFVYGGYRQVDDARRPLSTHRAVEFPDGFAGLLAGNHIAMHGTVLYDTGLLRAAGGFDPALPSCEDYDVYLRLARRHPIGAYDGIGADYRRHGATMSRRQLRMIGTARHVIGRHARGRGLTSAQRDAARAGKQFMTRYYCGEVSAELEAARHGGRLRDAVRDLLRTAWAHPVAFGHLLAYLIAEWLRPRR